MLDRFFSLFGGGGARGRADLARAEIMEARAAYIKSEVKNSIRARYDSAQTTDENQRLWAQTDLFSAKAANSYSVRSMLRRRSRYTVGNNSYAQGICRTKANDLIGTGPTLQGTTKNSPNNLAVETAFGDWCRAVDWVGKLRTQALAKIVDGEGFLVLKNNERVENSVKLYPLDVEADQVTTPNPKFSKDYWVDGLTLDEAGNAVSYNLLRFHPGDLFMPLLNPLEYDTVKAAGVIHWFRKDRPGQVRGIPELTPALDLFEEMRAYRKTVLSAARLAASFSAVLETEFPAGADDDTAGVTPFTTVPVDSGMIAQMPYGMKMHQFESKQPIANFDTFLEKLLGEACRVLDVPLNVALGTSQKFNFSSARLDILGYRANLTTEREQCSTTVLEHVFREWFEEAVMVPGLLPKGITYAEFSHEWHWPEFEALDPLTEANANTINRAGGMVTDAQYLAKRGIDWNDHYEQLAREQAKRQELGLVFGEPVKQTITDPNADAQSGNDKPQAQAALMGFAHAR
jgi:lambda family phage portal protein